MKLIPDKSIRVHLVEISPTMRASRKEKKKNIRNGDRTNVQVHWHDTIKKFLPNFIRTRIHDACCSRVLRRASNTHPTSNSSWWPQILKKVAERKIIQMKTQRPSSFRHVLKPRPSDLAHILGRSSFKFQNLRDRSSLEVSFKRITNEREVFFSNWGLRFDC